MPLWTEGRFSYVLAQKWGGLATYTDISWSWTLTASQSNGINIESNLAWTSSLTANANLITSMMATLVGSWVLSAGMVGTVQLAAELVGSGDVVGWLKMFAWLSASLNGSWSLDWTMKGFANMSADIYVNQSQATVKELIDWVWNAVATEYNNPWTMGEAAQTGWWSGWGATPAQIWSYSNRTLTEAAWLTIEQAIQLESASNATKWSDIIDDNDDIAWSFGNKFSQYGWVSHVIDRSSFDETSKKELEDLRNSFKKTAEDIQKSITNIKPPQIVSEWKTTVIKYDDKSQKFIEDFITDTIPELADKIDNLIPLLKTYEELILDLEQKEKDYEKLIEELINNK